MTAGSQNLFDLSGKVAIVTGGAQGLGEAIARALACHGARTVLVDINRNAAVVAAERMAADGLDVRAFACDVQDDDQVRGSIVKVLEQCGRIDVLVNNAGIHRRHSPFDFPRADIELLLGINLLGGFFMARAAARSMIAQGSGSIINVSALGGGVVGLGRGGSIYGATKGAIVALTRDLAAEWAKHAVRVNAVAPGWMRTPMSETLQHNAVQSRQVIERVPLGRWGDAEEVAGPVVFLASDASRFITGHVIPVDGGASSIIQLAQESQA